MFASDRTVNHFQHFPKFNQCYKCTRPSAGPSFQYIMVHRLQQSFNSDNVQVLMLTKYTIVNSMPLYTLNTQ